MVFERKPKPLPVKYPKSIAFIISNEFCERFCFYGLRTILVLYLTGRLGYNDDDATVLFHVFTSIVYFCPIFGAILADSWLGRFKTIMYLSVVYTIGSAIIAIGAIPTLNLPASLLTVIGLILIAIGTGGIKPCVSAFGGDQFKMPEQAKQLATFFSLFYMAINAGSLLSTTITPILREDVHCFGEETCFSLAFGVPGVLMVISIFIFIFGKPFYHITKPSGNMLVKVSQCIGNAIWTRSTNSNAVPSAQHWLDYAKPKFGQKLVDETKALMQILVLYLPLPIFWALQDQQGSRWTFQATRMTGEIGSFTIKPDQMQVLNPLLIIVCIPLWEVVVYPLLERCNIRRPLQKMTLGMILAGLAFLISAMVELRLEATDPVLPGPSEAQLRIFNGLDCSLNFRTGIPAEAHFTLAGMDTFERKHISMDQPTAFAYATDSTTCPSEAAGNFRLVPAEATSYFVTTTIMHNNTVPGVRLIEYKDSAAKPHQGLPQLRVLATTTRDRVITFKGVNKQTVRTFASNSTELISIAAGVYDILVDALPVHNVRIYPGGVYTFVVSEKTPSFYNYKLHTVTEPSEMHILWQVPQYVVITAGEIMFSVTGLEFSFTQAPESMKSVLQACWLLAVAFGNIIVVIIAELKFFKSQAYEFLLFFGMMAVDVLIFVVLAMRYVYRQDSTVDDTEHRNGDRSPPTLPMSVQKGRGGIENSAYTGDT